MTPTEGLVLATARLDSRRPARPRPDRPIADGVLASTSAVPPGRVAAKRALATAAFLRSWAHSSRRTAPPPC